MFPQRYVGDVGGGNTYSERHKRPIPDVNVGHVEE